jgi:hypothetical protein
VRKFPGLSFIAGPPSPDENTAPHQGSSTFAGATKPGPGGEIGTEDMLQMALRMASEMTEGPIMDLEDNVDAAPVRHCKYSRKNAKYFSVR